MIYLYLSDNYIKVLSLSKSLLGQYHFSFFEKYHESSLLENGKVKNIDLVASAIKEALTLAKPQEIKEKEVILILPQTSFLFGRYQIPPDISESAIIPFIRDKARVDFSIPLEEMFYNYLFAKTENETLVLFFAQEKNNVNEFEEVFRLLDLSLKAIIPETLAYYELFNKTLRKGKKENILYVNYQEKLSFGYLYDSYALLKPDRYLFKKDVEKELKTRISELGKEEIPVDRVVLSGKNSEKIRQDFFTKNIGAWTNPLKRILTNFYGEYLKFFILPQNSSFSFLDYDVCLGAFIFLSKNKSFSIIAKKPLAQPVNLKTIKKSESYYSSSKIKPSDVFIFLLAFLFSFLAIFTLNKTGLNLFSQGNNIVNLVKPLPPTPTTIPPTNTPTPTPSFKKEDLKIKVLNGSGTPGKASEVKDILKQKGYGEILVGNADNFNYQKTEVQIKTDFKNFFPTLKNDLIDYVDLRKESSLPAETTADVIIIIGKDFK